MRKLIWLALLLGVCVNGFAQVPRSHHVVVLTLENHSYEQVIGNPEMPYYNQLANQYGLATQYYATEHNSITGLMWLVAGAPITHDDSTQKVFDADNIVRAMKNSGGRSWRVYASGLPSIGFTDYASGSYLKRHNPLAYFTDVINDPAQRKNLLPLDPYFQRDIANGTLPEYSYVVPDADEDAHDGTLAQADHWMQANIPQLLNSPQFRQDGILLVVWDEGTLNPIGNFQHNDDRGEGLKPAELVYNPEDPETIWAIPGGRTATLVMGPQVKARFKSQSFYNAQNLLRTTCDALALTSCPGAGAMSVPMIDFFVGRPDTPPRQPREVVISSPAGSTFNAPVMGSASVHLVANAVDCVSRRVTGMIAYVDGQRVAGGDGISQIDTTLSLTPSSHNLVINAWSMDTSAVAGQADKLVLYQTQRMLTVGTGSAPTTVDGRVTDISTGKPIAGATVTLEGSSRTADGSGNFSFTSIAPGTYPVQAKANGFFAESTSVTAASGVVANVSLKLPTGGKLAGTIANASGAAIANATVVITGGAVSTTLKMTTNASGGYNSNWVPVGAYVATVTASGHATKTSSATVSTGSTTTLNVKLN